MLAFLAFTALLIALIGSIHMVWNKRRDAKDASDASDAESLSPPSGLHRYSTDRAPDTPAYIENEEFEDRTDFEMKSFRYPI